MPIILLADLKTKQKNNTKHFKATHAYSPEQGSKDMGTELNSSIPRVKKGDNAVDFHKEAEIFTQKCY